MIGPNHILFISQKKHKYPKNFVMLPQIFGIEVGRSQYAIKILYFTSVHEQLNELFLKKTTVSQQFTSISMSFYGSFGALVFRGRPS
jgi:hypothetical protein